MEDTTEETYGGDHPLLYRGDYPVLWTVAWAS